MTENNPEIDKITLVDENGDEALFEVLFTFHSEEYDRDYILLVPDGVEEDEQVDVQAYIFKSSSVASPFSSGLKI